MQPSDQEPSLQESQALLAELSKLVEQVAELEISSSAYIFSNHREIESLNQEIQELRKRIEELAKHQSAVVKRNTRNIAFLRNCGIGALAIASFSSALSWNAGEFSWHGDRIQQIIIALGGCGGLAFLGFRKIEEKNDSED